MIRVIFGLILVGFLVLYSQTALAYPEMIRHGYVNCTTCHVSPNGGGVLTDYGRDLSRELLATWKSEDENSKEHLALYGALSQTPLQKWLKVGGDVRSLYLYQDDQFVTQGKTLLMQAGIEAAVKVDRFTAVGTLDYESDSVLSRRHYLMAGINDEFTFRVGKYIPAYGINTADHVSLTRTPIRVGPRFESYNAELSYIKEQYSVFLTGIFGRPLSLGTPSESGAAVQGSYSFSENNKVGLNVLRGSDLQRDRWLFGPFGLIGITKQMMVMTEIDFQSIKAASGRSGDRFGMLSTQKLSYEFTDGFWGYLLQEYGKTHFKNERSATQVYGLGLQFFPRTHFEFNVAWQRMRMDTVSTNFYDYAWFVAHFYL